MKYKAKAGYKDLKNKHFHFGTQKTLETGGSVELDEDSFKKLPTEVKKELELLDKPKQVLKTDTKKKTEKEK